MKSESKRSIKARLEADGRWKAYRFSCESWQRKLTKSGDPITNVIKSEAKKRALLEFQPLKPGSRPPSDPSLFGAPPVEASGGIDGDGADDQVPPDDIRALMEKAPNKNDREIINWVKEHLICKIGVDVVPDDAPSPFSWFLLKWCQDNNGYNATRFVEVIWKQTLPTAKMMEERSKLKDAREANNELLDRFVESILKEQEREAKKEAA